MTARTLTPTPLTSAGFSPFGDVIEARGSGQAINDDTCVRFNDLARVETVPPGLAGLSVFRAAPRTLPLRIAMLERHPLGSQAFMPLDGRCFIVVAAKSMVDGKGGKNEKGEKDGWVGQFISNLPLSLFNTVLYCHDKDV